MSHNAEREKLDELAARIRQAEQKSPDDADPTSANMKASRVGYDFVASILGSLLLGWLLDAAFPVIAPWGLVAMVPVGFAVGMMNMWRNMSKTPPDDDHKDQQGK